MPHSDAIKCTEMKFLFFLFAMAALMVATVDAKPAAKAPKKDAKKKPEEKKKPKKEFKKQEKKEFKCVEVRHVKSTRTAPPQHNPQIKRKHNIRGSVISPIRSLSCVAHPVSAVKQARKWCARP